MWIPARQRWPNTQAQWVTRLGGTPACFSYRRRFSFHYVYIPKQTHSSLCTHQADASYTGLGHRTLAHLRGLFPEEEVQLVVISLRAVGDEVHVDESGICGEKRWWDGGKDIGKHLAEIKHKRYVSISFFLLKNRQTPLSSHFSYMYTFGTRSGLYVWKVFMLNLHESHYVSFTGEIGVLPFSHLELYWSVRMAVFVPKVRKMAESVPIKST